MPDSCQFNRCMDFATFNSAGTHTMVATLSDSSTRTVTLRVHSADLGAAFSARCGYYRDWTPTSLCKLPPICRRTKPEISG
ncbi:MAG TPA: hypothetical protein VM735_03445 [Candidatus Kapabacteria bacterium]|jgi:hypothetical protein|nr:hypothetical protein [Candidatus Kapabacteria bacterium]